MRSTTTTATLDAGHPRRSATRSPFRRAALAAVPALAATTMFLPSADARPRPMPDPDDPVVIDDGDGGGGSTGGSTGGTSDTCGPEASTTYKVTLQKFRVTSQTHDNFFQVDGKGDEVFVSYKNVKLDDSGNILTNYGENNTKTMGDRNGYPEREKAGSLSDDGGLKAGDVHTTNKVLWQGHLGEGEVVVITPTIWEWDGGGDGFKSWSSWASQLGSRLSDAADELLGEEVGNWVSLVDIGLSAVASMPVGTAGDKPIGSVDTSDGMTFTPEMLVLDQRTAAEITSSNPIGEGRCIVGVNYAGSGDHGNYTLYLKVERV